MSPGDSWSMPSQPVGLSMGQEPCEIKMLKAVATKLLLVCAAAALLTSSVHPQKTEYQETRLLNGLRLVILKRPDEQKVTLKLRVHSGSAFDPLGKEGTMNLLSRALFPNEELREFFRDDLGGSFLVFSNFDFIQIEATGNRDRLLEVLETVAAGITAPQINKTVTAKVKEVALEELQRIESDAGYAASLEAARGLVGNFPYGRPQNGSSKSVSGIDFADLLKAEERFVTADNSTMLISGDVEPGFVLRAVRRLFGGWNKSDGRVPPTFARPETPKTRLISGESALVPEGSLVVRSAVRGFSRDDARHSAGELLEIVLRSRLGERFAGDLAYFKTGALLPSVIIFGGSGEDVERFPDPLDILQTDLTEQEFGRAKQILAARRAGSRSVDHWLDRDTYGLKGDDGNTPSIDSLTLAEVRGALAYLRSSPGVTVVMRAPKPQAAEAR